MTDLGYNEVTIRVTTEDAGKAARDAIRAQYEALGKTPVVVPVEASDPVTDAWRAKVNAEIKTAAKEALNIPVTAETDEFRAQVAETLASMKDIAREQIPLEATQADTFRASVLAAVEETRAEIGAIIVPVTAEGGGRLPASQVPDLTQEAGVREVSGAFPDSEPSRGSGGPSGYGQVAAQIESSTPLELPVVAANPITDAWRAQVTASLRSITTEAVKIPVDADTAPFRDQVATQLQELSATIAAVPLEVANSDGFRSQVTEEVAAISASVQAVIRVTADGTSLADLRTKILAAADASAMSAKAQDELAAAQAAANADPTAKSQATLAGAEEEAAAAAEADARAQEQLAAAQEASAATAVALGDGEQVAAAGGRAMGAAMGPLWMLINVAQIAMFAFGSTSSSTATQVQDVSQQIINLGNATGSTAQSMLGGSASLQKVSAELTTAGTSASAFTRAYSGSIQGAQQYTDALRKQYDTLGSSIVTVTGQGTTYDAQGNKIAGTVNDQAYSVKNLTDTVNQNKDAYDALDPASKALVDQYNALHDIVPQAANALAGMKAEADANTQALAALGYTMTAGQTAANDYGMSVQANAKSLTDATAGATYLENATDKASITAGQGVQSWQQLQAAVTTASQAYAQAGQGVANAEHSVVTASQGVASAMHAEEQASQGVQSALHSEQQAVIATQQAQQAYTNSVYAETQAQQAVTAARAAAEQQLVSLRLTSNDAAQSVNAANLSLEQATRAAAALGVNSGNAGAIAGGPINAGNEAQVAAADALIQAQNQVADAQNAAQQAQSGLNTARQQGVENNPAVLAAEHNLSQSQAAVAAAALGVTDAQYNQQQATLAVSNAQYSQQQSAIAVSNAEWGLHSAELAVGQAQDAEHTALLALTTAQDNASRSVDQNTLAGAQNRQMLENIFVAYENATGNEQIAAAMTQTVGDKMGFTSQQIGDVLASLNGLNGTNTQFSITGTPSVNPQQLVQVGNELGLNFGQIEASLISNGAKQGTGRAQAVGGPGGGLTWVGEQGPELVHLAPGSQVMPNANSMGRVAAGEVRAPGFAAGGAVGALGMDLPITAQWGALDVVGQMLHAFGGPAVNLPQPGSVDMGPYAGGSGGGYGGGSNVTGDRAANKAIMQQVFAGFGWGGGAEWAASDYLEMREAGYNNLAQNPTSTAFGMGQFLDGTWAGYGISKTSDPTLQSIGMARYIGARYGDPIGAAAHERAFNWYAAGGPTAEGWAMVGEQGPEMVRLPAGAQVSPNANSTISNQTSSKVEVVISFGGQTDSALATAFMKLVRSGEIQLSANGAPVRAG